MAGERTGRSPRACCAIGRHRRWSGTPAHPQRARMPGHACRGRHRAVLAPCARRHRDRHARPGGGGRGHRARRPGGRGRPPRGAAAPSRSGRASRSATCRCPRQALYRTWHRWRRPGVERATGPVDVVHATGYAIPPRTAPLVVTLHDLAWRREPSMFTANGVRFFEAGLRCVLDDADLVLARRRRRSRTASAAGIARTRLRHVPWGMTAVDAVRRRRGRRARALRPHRALRAVGGDARAPQEPAAPASRRSPACPQRDVTLVVVGPDGLGRRRRRPR